MGKKCKTPGCGCMEFFELEEYRAIFLVCVKCRCVRSYRLRAAVVQP